MLQKACLTYYDDKYVRDSMKSTTFATRVEHNVGCLKERLLSVVVVFHHILQR